MDKVHNLISNYLVKKYHESNGKLYEGTTVVYYDDLVELITEIFGTTTPETRIIVSKFYKTLSIKEYYKPKNLEELLVEELRISIDSHIIREIFKIETP